MALIGAWLARAASIFASSSLGRLVLGFVLDKAVKAVTDWLERMRKRKAAAEEVKRQAKADKTVETMKNAQQAGDHEKQENALSDLVDDYNS